MRSCSSSWGHMSHPRRPSDIARFAPSLVSAPSAPIAERWGWIELFAAIQLLWGALLFIPAAQSYRMLIRAAPYVASFAGLVVFFTRRASVGPLPTTSRWLLASFALLAMSLLHPDTHLRAGIAQVIFQISIAAPMFWVGRALVSPERLARVLWIIFA